MMNAGGHDIDGRILPVFVHVSGNAWLPPLPVYASAVILKFRSSSAPPAPQIAQLRLIVAIVGIVDVLLVYVLVVRVFESPALAFLAGLMVLVSPAHFRYSRLASSDGVWQVPFVILWLIGLAGFIDARRVPSRWMLAVALASLVASVYSQPSASTMLPWLLVITVLVLHRTTYWEWRDLIPACTAAIAVLLPLMVWFIRYPLTYIDTLGAWMLHPAYIRHPIEWVRAWKNIQTLSVCGQVFWDFFRPSHLFLKSDAAGDPMFSLVTGILLVVGVVETIRMRSETRTPDIRTLRFAVLAGFILAPLAEATFRQRWPVERTLAVVPFGAFLSTVGLVSLMRIRSQIKLSR
jgi:hypothetical protein